MKSLKRFLGLVLLVTFTITLIGCGTEPDETAPVFSGLGDMVYTIGDDTPNYLQSITAEDDIDGDITESVVVDASEVDLEVAGTYTITVTVSDAAGNETTDTFDIVVSEKVYTEEELAQMDIAAMNMPDTVGTKISLPSFGSNGTQFFWKSSNSHVITNRGFVIKPPVGNGPETVTLTATVKNGTHIEQITFDYTVQPNPTVSVTSSKELPFVGTSEEYIVDDVDAVDVFFVNNGTVPYMDIETFILMLDGAIDTDILTFTPVGTDGLNISYNIEYEDFDGTDVSEDYLAEIDFTDNTFTVNNFGFFGNYISSTESDYGEGLEYVDADYVDGKEVTIPLGEYNVDIITYDDEGTTLYLMPIAVANLLFAGDIYYNVYYNGDTIYGIDTFGISSGDEEALAIQEQVRTSSYNTKSMSVDMQWATYHFLALTFDYFYGLKEDRGVKTYYDVLAPKAEDFIGATDSEFYGEIFDFAYGVDDLHTSHAFRGYYHNDPTTQEGLSINDLGSRTTAFYEGLWDIQDELEAKFGSLESIPDYELIDDDETIAVIYLQGFTIDSPDEFKSIVRSLPSSVENVVIDLAYNTGGNIGAVFRIFGYMTEETFKYHSQNPADNSKVTYYIESSYNAYDEYNWYIKTSSVTFSAANLMTSIAKEQGIATIIGQKSSGGASSIGAVITPDGSTMLISTNNVLSTLSGTRYYSIENGITPNITMSNVYSDTELIKIITEDQAAE